MKPKEMKRLKELVEKYHLVETDECVTIELKGKTFSIINCSLLEKLPIISKYFNFKNDVMERFRRVIKKYDYIYNNADFKKEKEERKIELYDDFMFSIYELLKNSTFVFQMINFEGITEFSEIFPEHPIKMSTILIDLMDCIDYAILVGLKKLEKRIKNNEYDFSLFDNNTNQKVEGSEPLIKAIKALIDDISDDKPSSNFKFKISSSESKFNEIDLHNIDPKNMGKA